MNDLISRKAAIDALISESRIVDGHYIEYERIINEDDAIEAISMLPSAEPKKGQWYGIYDGYADGNPVYDEWECSCCGFIIEDDNEPTWNYCPNCGAKMRVTEK